MCNASILLLAAGLSAIDSSPYISLVLITASNTCSLCLIVKSPCLQNTCNLFNMIIQYVVLFAISCSGSPLLFSRHPRYFTSCFILAFVLSLNLTAPSVPNGRYSHLSLFCCNHYFFSGDNCKL